MTLVFTSCTFGYLDRARVLAKTVKRFHPDWKFALVMVDEEPEQFIFNMDDEPFDIQYRIKDLQLKNYEAWMFGHDIVELCTAVKGPFLKKFVKDGWDKIIYLDPDIAVYNSLTPIEELLDQYSVVLTPHQVTPETEEDAIRDNEITALNYGVYNLGFLAIRNDNNGKKLANWWNDRLLEYCHDDLPRGLFVDQKWFDLVPAMFDSVHILRDPGYNVASWNLSHRKLTIRNSCIYVNDIYPLRFYHFTKLGPIGQTMTKKYAKDNYDVFEVWADYERQVIKNKPSNLPDNWWFYGVYSDGISVAKEDRLRFRHDLSLQKKYPKPLQNRAALQLKFKKQKEKFGQKSEKKKRQIGIIRFLEKNTRTIRRIFK